MKSLRTPEDYFEAAAQREVEQWERDVQEGRIVLIPCPVCGLQVTDETLPAEEHLCGLGEEWGRRS